MVEKTLSAEPKKKYAICLDGENACPPEDCGGIWGYYELLKAVKNPKHKEHQGMTPHQFVTRERMLQAQQLIRETCRSLIEIALEVGYTSPSHFAQVFRRTVGMAPTQFRNAL